jgi:solute carrier family 25 S-adenosylmethionine transporter 26
VIGAQALDRELRSYEAALCGSVAGGIAAFFTTPLDVVRTRLILGRDTQGMPYNGFLNALGRIRTGCNVLLVQSTLKI